MLDILAKAACYICIIILGFFLRRIGFFDEHAFPVLSKLVIRVTLPAALIASAAGREIDPRLLTIVLLGFGGIMICQWLLFLFYACIRRTSFEVELIAFFLCTMGMCAISTVVPGEAMKQLIAMLLGLFIFLIVGWSLRDLERAKMIRYIAAVAGIAFVSKKRKED